MSLTRPLVICVLFLVFGLLAACDRVRLPGAQDNEPAAAGPQQQTQGGSDADMRAGPVASDRPEASVSESQIDWDAARRDLAANFPADGTGAFQIASGETAPPVPIFLPSSLMGIQGGEAGVRFQPVADGYYAFFPGPDYDVIINGTNRTIAAPEQAGRVRTEEMVFQTTTTGAQVFFARYGADYLVEFECRVLVAGLASCIDRDQALAFAAELVISGSR